MSVLLHNPLADGFRKLSDDLFFDHHRFYKAPAKGNKIYAHGSGPISVVLLVLMAAIMTYGWFKLPQDGSVLGKVVLMAVLFAVPLWWLRTIIGYSLTTPVSLWDEHGVEYQGKRYQFSTFKRAEIRHSLHGPTVTLVPRQSDQDAVVIRTPALGNMDAIHLIPWLSSVNGDMQVIRYASGFLRPQKELSGVWG